METPFSDIEINRDYVLKFYGRTLQQLIDTCILHRVELPTRALFYGTCISRSPVDYRLYYGIEQGDPSIPVVTLTWELKTNTYKIKNTGEAGFMILQQELYGFAETDDIRYYATSGRKMKHLDDIYKLHGMIPTMVPENEAYWYKPRVETRHLHRIPYTDLDSSKDLICYRGNQRRT